MDGRIALAAAVADHNQAADTDQEEDSPVGHDLAGHNQVAGRSPVDRSLAVHIPPDREVVDLHRRSSQT